MYENPGTKCKALAFIIMGINVVVGVIYGLTLFGKDHFFLGLLAIGGGALTGWLCSIMLYTIGDIAETVDTIAYRVGMPEKKTDVVSNTAQENSFNPETNDEIVHENNIECCPKCGTPFIPYAAYIPYAVKCSKCGYLRPAKSENGIDN